MRGWQFTTWNLTMAEPKLGKMKQGLGAKAPKAKKGRKSGNNSRYCARYAATHQREKNKLKRLLKHAKKHLADLCAKRAIDSCKVILGLR